MKHPIVPQTYVGIDYHKRKEVMRQRAVWVKQRTQLRNRVHQRLDRLAVGCND